MLDISASVLVEWLCDNGIKNYHANKKKLILHSQNTLYSFLS